MERDATQERAEQIFEPMIVEGGIVSGASETMEDTTTKIDDSKDPAQEESIL